MRPSKLGELDCNGFSPIQKPVKPDMTCAEPRGRRGGRFSDNGHYVGHDEPSLRFLSSRPGSGNNISMTEYLPAAPWKYGRPASNEAFVEPVRRNPPC